MEAFTSLPSVFTHSARVTNTHPEGPMAPKKKKTAKKRPAARKSAKRKSSKRK